MSLLNRSLLVLACAILGGGALTHVVLGNTGGSWLMSSRIGDWRKAEVRPACYPATGDSVVDPLAPKEPAGEHRIDIMDGLRASQMTIALNCYLITQRNAVCEPNNRAYIVDYIGSYMAKKDEMLATGARYGDREVRNVQTLWNSPLNRAIDAALEAAIRQGRLTRGDFGWSAPASLKPLLEQYAGAPDGCRNEAAWAPVPIRLSGSRERFDVNRR
jgi:hypothetical protein